MQKTRAKTPAPPETFEPELYETPEQNKNAIRFFWFMGAVYAYAAYENSSVMDAFTMCIWLTGAILGRKLLVTAVELHSNELLFRGSNRRVSLASIRSIKIGRLGFRLALENGERVLVSRHLKFCHVLLDRILYFNPTIPHPKGTENFRASLVLNLMRRTLWKTALRITVWPAILYVAFVAISHLPTRAAFNGAVIWLSISGFVGLWIEIVMEVALVRRLRRIFEKDRTAMDAARACGTRIRKITDWIHYAAPIALAAAILTLLTRLPK